MYIMRPTEQDQLFKKIPGAERLLTPREVAAIFHVDAKTVTRWAKRGAFRPIVTPFGHRRYRLSEVQAYLNANGISSEDLAA